MANSLFDGTSMEEQWQLYRIQLINWGTFDGVREAYFATDFEGAAVTVVSGASGTGKSTMQDAYDEVMMRAPKFNAASNVGGRGVGAGTVSGKRTLHSYARGMLDSVFDEATQTESARYLRDSSCSRWTAIGASFVNGLGGYFTAAKLYYLVPECDKVDSENTRFVTAPELLDLSVLDSVAQRKFDKRSIGRVLPRAKQHANRSEFLDCVYRSLGIGDEDKGTALMELLARIRSGKDFKTVSALFNELVLERPRTYEAADKAIEHFDSHSEVHEKMLKVYEQKKALEPIVGHKQLLDESNATANICRRVGSARVYGSPLARWLRWRKYHVSCEVKRGVDAKIAQADAQLADLQTHKEALDARLLQLSADMNEAGAGKIASLDARIEAAKVEANTRKRRRDALQRDLKRADIAMPADATAFGTACDRAKTFLAAYDDLDRLLDEEAEAIAARKGELDREAKATRSDLEYYQSHRGNIPRALSEARDAMADAAGLSPEELPFAGELMELREGEERWRDAVEICLHSLSRTVLVDRRAYDAFSRDIDPVKLGARVSFRGIDVGDTTFDQGRAGGVASKLELNTESPFAPWLSRVLADENHDALCVEDAADLKGDDLRITRAGQTRRGFKGAHGRGKGDRNVIGFTNEGTIARLTERLASLVSQITAASAEQDAAKAKRRSADQKRVACERLEETSFDEIDIAGAKVALDDLVQTRDEFLKGNTQLARLRAEYDQASVSREECTKAIGLQEGERGKLCKRAQQLNAEIEELAGSWSEKADDNEKDAASGSVAAAAQVKADAPAAVSPLDLPSAELRHIETTAKKPEGYYATAEALYESYQKFSRAVDDANQRLLQSSEDTAERERAAIEAIFVSFQQRWYDPNRGETLESYDEYAAVLDEIKRQGIDEKLELWRSRMVSWIREDLVPLRHSYNLAVQEIRDRIDPINEILADLPFGAANGRLRIALHERESRQVADFRRALGLFAGNATAEDLDVVKFYEDVREFIDRLRLGNVERDALLDRRRHVRISAKAIWPEELGRQDSYYNSLAGKSGGEVQELVAFILGSALLYALGGEVGQKPVFAPVMLDEGFIKADSDFTARAVAAWKSFGFQLIVATPEDKFQSIAPYAAGCVYITKDARGASHVVQIGLAEDAGDKAEPLEMDDAAASMETGHA